MAGTGKIRVLIADDHAITRDGIKTLLKVYDDLSLAGEATNGREAVESCRQSKPDVVLMDLDMPVLGGVAAISEIMKELPDTRIIALTSFVDKKLVKNAIRAGAAGYVIKNISPQELADSIRDAYSGKAFFSPEATEVLMGEIREPSDITSRLTAKEKQILVMIARGCSNKTIASELFVSDNTVKFHISNILSKLGVSNRAQAAAIAVREHLIE